MEWAPWLDWFHWLLGKMADLLNSNFTAAFAGAATAAWLAKRAKKNDDLIAEVTRTKAAIELCFTVCNAAIGMKRQHIQKMKDAYDANHDTVHAHYNGIAAGTVAPNTVLDLGELHLLMLDKIRVPIERLENIVMQLGISGKARPLLGGASDLRC